MHKRLLLRPADFTPSQNDVEVVGVFNPGVTECNGNVVMLARVAEQAKRHSPAVLGLPRWESTGQIVVDQHSVTDFDVIDPRVVHVRGTNRRRLTFTSYLRLVNCGSEWTAAPHVESIRFTPHERWEEFGVEDPRITHLDGQYYVTYVAVSRHGAATALAATENFRKFARLGIIFPPENKDVVLFPEKIGGRYCALHRPTGATPFSPPEMWVAWSHDLQTWGYHEPLVVAEGRPWASGRVGSGAPPVRVDDGWLVIYHANRRSTEPGRVGRYVAAALLLDADNPGRILAQGSDALFEPTESYEREGFVPDVTFPTGAVVRGDRMSIYYGAGDTNIAVVEMKIADILNTLVAPR